MATDERSAKLSLGVETKGVDKAAKEIAGIGKAAKQTEKDLLSILAGGGEVRNLTEEFKKADKEAQKLADDIRNDLKGSLDEAAQSASGIRTGGSGSSGIGGAPAAAKFRGAASLIGGGEIVGLIDDFQDLGEGLMELKDAAPGAVDGLMKLASGIGSGGLLAAGAAGIALIALGAAIKGFVDEQAKNQAVIEGIVDSQRDIQQKINAGATTSELTSERDLLIKNLADEEQRLKDLNAQYTDNFEGMGRFSDVLKIVDGAEEGLSNSINETSANVEKYRAQIEAINDGLKDGDLAANDAAAAEKDLAQVRQTETPKAIDTAARAERDRAREQERAQQQAQREQEQAAREAQQNAEKAAAAQQKYADGIKNANTAFKQAGQDINTKLGQALADNLTGMFRDVEDIATQFRRDTFDADLKANQAERDAFTEHLRDIDDIREEAYQSEREALQDGNFKEAFLSRRAGQEALQREQLETRREGADRRQALQDERGDLLRGAQQQRTDRLTALGRANADAQTAAQRELQQAQVTRTRALEMNASSYKAELSQLGQFLQARNQLLVQANQQALAQLGGNRSGGSSGGLNSVGQSIQQQMNAAILAVMR